MIDVGSVWVFSGQVAPWVSTATALIGQDQAFTAALTELDPLINAEAGFSVLDMLRPGHCPSGINQIQPTLFAIQLALGAAWRAHGVHPAAVIGFSMGEVAAAVTAGALTPADGVTVICQRSALLTHHIGTGAMALIALPHTQVQAELAEVRLDYWYGWSDDGGAGQVSIAAVTSPDHTMISGDVGQVRALTTRWRKRDVTVTEIGVDVAAHCAAVDPILAPLRHRIAHIHPTPPHMPFYSTVQDPLSGHRTTNPALDAAYWAANLRQPVRFADAITTALTNGHRTFIEISPHPLLTTAIEHTTTNLNTPATVLPTLIRGRDAPTTLLASVSAALDMRVPP